MKKGCFISKLLLVFVSAAVLASFSGCAYVSKGYQLYPLGVSVKTNSQKSIYVQPATDKRADNVKATMFFGDNKPTKYLTRFEERFYFVEDPSVQTAAEFFTGAVQNDLRDAGYKIANSKNSADYVMILQINRLDGHKEAPIINQILGVLTFGFLFKYDIVCVADFNAYLMDPRTNKKVLGKHYKSEETKEEYLMDVYSYSTDYYLTRQIKMGVKELLNDVIKTVK